MKEFPIDKDTIEPTYIWDNGVKVLERKYISWQILESYNGSTGYQFLNINTRLSLSNNYDRISFLYFRTQNRLNVNGVDFYVKNIDEATKMVLSNISILSIDLSDKIYITPRNKRNKERRKKIKRIID
jgi:hypothetical protein